MKKIIDSKTRREKIRKIHLIEQEQYKACEKSSRTINPIFTRPPYSACAGKEK